MKVTDTNGILLKEPLPLLFAKHTEEDLRFQVYPYRTGDLLLCDIYSEHQGEKVMVIPPRILHLELANTIWEHFKSTSEHPMTYEVLGLGIDLDSSERYVLYSPQYEEGRKMLREQGVSCLARPEEMFFSEVERDEYKGPRFRKIG